jgi:hypothetical protein
MPDPEDDDEGEWELWAHMPVTVCRNAKAPP